MAVEAHTDLERPVHAESLDVRREDTRQIWMTALMADLVNSTGLSFDLSPVEFRRAMLEYYAVCTSIVERHSGTVLRYVGDGVFAAFGLRRRTPEDAANAVAAAREIVTEVPRIRVTATAGDAKWLAVRVSAATGWVITGPLIGHGPALQEGIFGAVPYLAANLNRVAEPNSIVVSETTHGEMHEECHARSLRAVPLKDGRFRSNAWHIQEPVRAAS